MYRLWINAVYKIMPFLLKLFKSFSVSVKITYEILVGLYIG